MGHNATRNPFNQAHLTPATQQAVDEYKARSVWGAWWSLDDETRDRFFNKDELRWIRRYGAKLNAIASMVEVPKTDSQRHFLEVCTAGARPKTDRERLWLRVQLVCRFEQAVERAARTDLAEHLAASQAAETSRCAWISAMPRRLAWRRYAISIWPLAKTSCRADGRSAMWST